MIDFTPFVLIGLGVYLGMALSLMVGKNGTTAKR